MDSIKQPQYVAYRLEGESDDGMQVHLEVGDGALWFVQTRGTRKSVWYVLHRSSDFANVVADTDDGNQYYTERSFFDPTWIGAYHALRDGMFFAEQHKTGQPVPQQIHTPPPQPTDDDGLKIIATTQVMGTVYYVVRDNGPTQCENGDQGRAVNLYARGWAEKYQLTGAVIDLALNRFCMVRFMEPDSREMTVEQHYGDVDGYWVQTDGVMYARLPMVPFGLLGHSWKYRLFGMTFPQYIPDYLFTAPTASGKASGG